MKVLVTFTLFHLTRHLARSPEPRVARVPPRAVPPPRHSDRPPPARSGACCGRIALVALMALLILIIMTRTSQVPIKGRGQQVLRESQLRMRPNRGTARHSPCMSGHLWTAIRAIAGAARRGTRRAVRHQI